MAGRWENPWTKQEEEIVRTRYNRTDFRVLLKSLPGRTALAVRKKAAMMSLGSNRLIRNETTLFHTEFKEIPKLVVNREVDRMITRIVALTGAPRIHVASACASSIVLCERRQQFDNVVRDLVV